MRARGPLFQPQRPISSLENQRRHRIRNVEPTRLHGPSAMPPYTKRGTYAIAWPIGHCMTAIFIPSFGEVQRRHFYSLDNFRRQRLLNQRLSAWENTSGLQWVPLNPPPTFAVVWGRADTRNHRPKLDLQGEGS